MSVFKSKGLSHTQDGTISTRDLHLEHDATCLSARPLGRATFNLLNVC